MSQWSWFCVRLVTGLAATTVKEIRKEVCVTDVITGNLNVPQGAEASLRR